MRWFLSRIRIRLGLVWRGAWQRHGLRLITGLLFAGLAAVLSYRATGRPSALMGIFAYPIGLVLIYGFYLVGWHFGWSRPWHREWQRQPPPDGPGLYVSLRPNGASEMAGRRERPEYSLVIRDPTGRNFRAGHVYQIAGQMYCLYPDRFDGAPTVTPGSYWISWQERKPTGSGKWRVFDAYRIKIPYPATVDAPEWWIGS
jgi:hypothetical protein